MLEQISTRYIKNHPAANKMNYSSNTYWRRIDSDIKRLLQWFLIICVNDGDSFGSHHGEMGQGLKNLSHAIAQKST